MAERDHDQEDVPMHEQRDIGVEAYPKVACVHQQEIPTPDLTPMIVCSRPPPCLRGHLDRLSPGKAKEENEREKETKAKSEVTELSTHEAEEFSNINPFLLAWGLNVGWN